MSKHCNLCSARKLCIVEEIRERKIPHSTRGPALFQKCRRSYRYYQTTFVPLAGLSSSAKAGANNIQETFFLPRSRSCTPLTSNDATSSPPFSKHHLRKYEHVDRKAQIREACFILLTGQNFAFQSADFLRYGSVYQNEKFTTSHTISSFFHSFSFEKYG